MPRTFSLTYPIISYLAASAARRVGCKPASHNYCAPAQRDVPTFYRTV